MLSGCAARVSAAATNRRVVSVFFMVWLFVAMKEGVCGTKEEGCAEGYGCLECEGGGDEIGGSDEECFKGIVCYFAAEHGGEEGGKEFRSGSGPAVLKE